MKLPSDSLPRTDGDLSKWTTRIELNNGLPVHKSERTSNEFRYDDGRRIKPYEVPYNGKLKY